MRGWSGSVELVPGLGVFRGHAGDNRPHRHWAHQLVLRRDAAATVPLELCCGGTPARLDSAFIPAGVFHQLGAAEVISVYLDPTTTLGRAAHASSAAGDRVVALPPVLARALRAGFGGALPAGQGAAHLRQALSMDADGRSPAPSDARLAMVLEALRHGVANGEAEAEAGQGAAHYAALAGLSASRFSHWFREQTGMPLRSYRKWLRLIDGLEHALGHGHLTRAAHQARFADQAHFTRTFIDMFGIRPSDVLAARNAV